MPEALPELVPLALLFFCFAFVWAARKLLVGIFEPIISAVHLIPYLGSALGGVLDAVVQAISNALGSVEHGIDSAIGWSWHQFAHLNSWLWHAFTQHTLIGWLAAEAISELSHGYRYLHNRATDLTAAHKHDQARVKSLEREYVGIEHKVKNLERDLSRGIGHDVLPRIKTLEREANHIENVELPAAIAAQRQADSAISDLYDWVKGKAALVGVGTFAFAVAIALSTLGLDWLRCSNVGKAGQRMCGLGTDLLDALLLATLAVEGAVSLVGLGHELLSLMDEIVPAVTGFVSELSSVESRTAAEQGFG